MSARIDPDAGALANLPSEPPAPPTAAALAATDPEDRWGGHALPHDHPAWMKDTVSLSQRAHALLAKLKPVLLHVVAVWEHRVRSIAVGGRRLSVDASGSYRLD